MVRKRRENLRRKMEFYLLAIRAKRLLYEETPVEYHVQLVKALLELIFYCVLSCFCSVVFIDHM